ncbi:MAG: hypothetical protein F4Y02_08845, partial [Chloroflexi bacterium]|nr:hypothetical protein [Chloroflexota bacterium]
MVRAPCGGGTARFLPERDGLSHTGCLTRRSSGGPGLPRGKPERVPPYWSGGDVMMRTGCVGAVGDVALCGGIKPEAGTALAVWGPVRCVTFSAASLTPCPAPEFARRERPSRRLSMRPRRRAGPASSRSFSRFLPRLPRAAARLAVAALLAAGVTGGFTGEAGAQTEVPADWGLKPSGIDGGEQFRLLIVTSSARSGSSSSIGDYDTHVQTSVASGHAQIRRFSSQFKALACTSSEDARDNTETTYTSSNKGVPIYWLNGSKVADDYEDFYDGSWDSTSPTSQRGTNPPGNTVWTGCEDDGTENTPLGDSMPTFGVANSQGRQLDGGGGFDPSSNLRVYGLSPVFQVALDTEAPEVDSAEVTAAKPKELVLTFDEALATDSVPDKGQFTVKVGGTAGPAIKSAAFVSGDATKLKLGLAVALDSSQTSVTVDYTKPATNPLKNAGGDEVASFTNQDVTNNAPACPSGQPSDAFWSACLTIGRSEALLTTGYFGSVGALSNTSVGALTVDALYSPDHSSRIFFSFTGDGAGPQSVAGSWRLHIGSNTHDFSSATYFSTSSNWRWDVSSVGWTEGQKITVALSLRPASTTTTAPTVTSAEVTAAKPKELVLTFDEALATDSVPDKGQFTVKVGGTAGPAIKSAAFVSGDATKLKLGLAVALDSSQTSVTVDYTKPGTNPLKNAGGDEVATFTGQAVTNNAPACPTGQPADAFWEACLTVGDLSFVNGFSSSAGGDLSDVDFTRNGTAYEIDTIVVGGSVLQLSFMADPRPASESWIFQVGSRTYGLGPADGYLSTTHTYRFSNPGFVWHATNVGDKVSVSLRQGDTTAPVLSTATVNGRTLVLTYDEDLKESSVPAPGDYTVRADGTGVAVSNVAVSGRTVTLTLAVAVGRGQAVTLDYTPGSSPVEDAAGNDAALLTGQVVPNETPQPGLVFTPPGVDVGEGAERTYTVALDARPAANVTVDITSPDTGAVEVVNPDPALLTFTTANWATPQTVTVTGVEDADDDDETVRVTHSGTGVTPASLAVRVNDDETVESEGMLRLADGPGPWEGRLEIYLHGRWGTVCDDRWNTVGRRVDRRGVPADNPAAVCAALHAQDPGSVGPNPDPFTVNTPQCRWNSQTSTHSVEMQTSLRKWLSLATMPPGPDRRGRNSCWGPGAAPPTQVDASPVAGSGQIWLDDLSCGKGASIPDQCYHAGAQPHAHNCVHREDVWIRCENLNPVVPAPAAQAPGAPGLQVKPGDGAATLTWTAPPEHADAVTGYQVRYGPLDVNSAETDWGEWTTVDSTAAEAMTHTIEDLVNGVAYAFQVRAIAGVVEGKTVFGTPSAPVLTSPGEAAAGLTAAFHDAPASHDGATAFAFELRLSEHVRGLSYRTLRDSAFTVTNGRVSGVRRLEPNAAEPNRRWEITVRPRASEDISIALTATGDCAAAGAICTADGKPLAGSVLLQVPVETGGDATVDPAPRVPLTAAFVDMPQRHNGSKAFTFELHFSEDVRGLGFRKVQRAFSVSRGRISNVRRINPNGPEKNRQWKVWVEPGSFRDVAVSLPPTQDCEDAKALCHGDGRMLSGTLSATIVGPQLSVADARVREGPGAALEFVVTQEPARRVPVTVDYATSDGTAVAGEDYAAVSDTLTFAAGETLKTVRVPVLDDAHDEGEETMTLTLSNAQGATIDDGVATGTIENSDPIPEAWLARFGRTVTGQVLDAVEARLTAPRAAGAQASLAGQALPSMGGGDTAAPEAANDAVSERERRAEAEARAGLAAMTSWLAGADEGRGSSGFGARDGG